MPIYSQCSVVLNESHFLVQAANAAENTDILFMGLLLWGWRSKYIRCIAHQNTNATKNIHRLQKVINKIHSTHKRFLKPKFLDNPTNKHKRYFLIRRIKLSNLHKGTFPPTKLKIKNGPEEAKCERIKWWQTNSRSDLKAQQLDFKMHLEELLYIKYTVV